MSVAISTEIAALDKQLFQNYLDTFVAKFGRHILYGTAGFRDNAKYLEHVCLRVGIFMGLFAKLEKTKVLGIMITASHNPIQDNGIKISDFDGSMIRNELEKQTELFVIEPNLEKAIAELVAVLQTFKGYSLENTGMVFVGQDTRPSCNGLVALIEKGLQSVGTIVRKTGEVTTPMLNHNVWYFNTFKHNLTRSSWTEQFTASFFNNYWTNFEDYMTLINFEKDPELHIVHDCSNGVGGVRIGPFAEALQKYYNYHVVNDQDHEHLNEHCGAEFVHKSQTYPVNIVEKLKTFKDLSKVRVVSYDGDADRILYFLPQQELKEIDLMDGDKMISLFGLYFKTMLSKLETATAAVNKSGILAVNLKPHEWKVGIVQTPYANGASSIYFKEKLNLEIFFSANGVKNLHPNAHKYDIGIYCESNGHGTFLVHQNRLDELEAIGEINETEIEGTPEAKATLADFLLQVRLLAKFIRIQNQSVGDSITNMLCVEAALATLKMTGQDYLNLYKDLKCKNSKVVIKDKSKLKMSAAEDIVLQPKEIQDKINVIVAKHPGARAFIRPSGTEDIVRVYAESEDMAVVDALTKEIQEMILADKTVN